MTYIRENKKYFKYNLKIWKINIKNSIEKNSTIFFSKIRFELLFKNLIVHKKNFIEISEKNKTKSNCFKKLQITNNDKNVINYFFKKIVTNQIFYK